MRSTASHPLPRRGYTLLETMVSLAVMSILLVSIGSSIVIATQAIPTTTSPAMQSIDTGRAMGRIASELQYATGFRVISPTAVEFTVHDRDNDGDEELIRYAWGGTAGQPITRTYNGGTAVNLVASAAKFNLAYEYHTVTWTLPPSLVESAEQVLISHDPLTLSASLETIRDDKWPTEYFNVALPVNAVAWRINRVQFKAVVEGSSTNQTTRVQVRPATTAKSPMTTVLDEVVVNEWTFGSFLATWEDVNFSNLTALSPGVPLALVLAGTSGNSSGQVLVDNNTSASPVTHYLEGNGIGGYLSEPDERMVFYIHGTITTFGSASTSSTTHIARIRVAADVGPGGDEHLETTVPILNAPKVTTP